MPLLSWPVVFGNDHPVEVEIGFGKGLFLLNAAEALSSIAGLANEAFKLSLLGEEGQEVVFDAGLYELVGGASSQVERVTVIRPGVYWSDGVRTRVIVRAMVQEASHASENRGTEHV